MLDKSIIEFIEIFENCNSYSEFEMNMALRGIDLQDEKSRSEYKNSLNLKDEKSLLNLSANMLTSCEERGDRVEFNMKRIECLKDFWRNPRGLFRGDEDIANSFIAEINEIYCYAIWEYRHDKEYFRSWKRLISFFIEAPFVC